MQLPKLEELTVVEKVLAGHSRHTDEADDTAYLPATHPGHMKPVAAEANVPGAHGMQWLLSTAARRSLECPTGQPAQLLADAAPTMPE